MRFFKETLVKNGSGFISTPNPYYITRVFCHLGGKHIESVDHVAMYYPSAVAELAERMGGVLSSWRGVYAPLRTWKGKLLKRIVESRLTSRLCPEALCETLIYELKFP